MSLQSHIPTYSPPHSFKTRDSTQQVEQPQQQQQQQSQPQPQQQQQQQPFSQIPTPYQQIDQTRTPTTIPPVNTVTQEYRPTLYRPNHYQDFQQQQQAHQQALQERKDSAAPLNIDTTRTFSCADSADSYRTMAVPMMPQRHMYPTLGASNGYQSYDQARSPLYTSGYVTSPRDYQAAAQTQLPAEHGYSYYYGPSQSMTYGQSAPAFPTQDQSIYMANNNANPNFPHSHPQPTSQPLTHTRYDSATVPDISRFVPSSSSSSSTNANNKPITTSIQQNKLESNASNPGPIPATTPLVVRQDSNGTQWIAFQYSRDRVKMEYTIRCDVESVNIDELDEPFKAANCVYPRACGPARSLYKGNRLQYETECNAVGWALANLNPELRDKRGLIQRAVDSWRNSNADEKLRSRRVRRLNKVSHRKAKMTSGQYSSSLWRMQSLSDIAASPGPSLTRSPSLGDMPDQSGHEHRHSDTSIDYTHQPTSHGLYQAI